MADSGIIEFEDGSRIVTTAAITTESLMAHMKRMRFERDCYDQLTECHKTPGRWKVIRAYYEYYHDDIMRSRKWDPYGIGLERFMTPIEEKLWQDIRPHGIPMLMQYPVGRFFVDFGDPRRRIAIECDGKQWHDPVKDAKRDAELLEMGWSVYRVKGYECHGEAGTAIVRNVALQYGCRCWDCYDYLYGKREEDEE